MGCTTSKQARRDLRRSPSPLPRSRSMPRHPKAGGANSSATLGCLIYGPPAPDTDDRIKDLSTELVKAKAWSAMIEKRIQKTPTETPPNEPEAVDAWELMAGLEDSTPLRPPTPTFVRHSFSFHATRDVEPVSESKLSSKLSNGAASPGPVITAADFDPEIISNFRKALEELSPQLRSPESVKTASRWKNRSAESTGIVRARIDAFQEIIDAEKDNAAKISQFRKCPLGGESKVVLYFTSLRGVRKTYEECYVVRMILRGYEVCIDERDVSMDRGFRDELTEILGTEYEGSWLPRVFANGRDLGGAEEVRCMHEAGELGKALEDCAAAFVEKGGRGRPCQGCGDVRFVLCERCSGSSKVCLEEEMEEEEEEEEAWGDVECGFRRCPDCNENGLVRCPVCC
ncbi:uncharacterized protein At3g28850-like [Phoenix dactylifera]|uniref:Uncharacterized protein At3g28850-like n=1 Tax=Phoenix dactylifera TaxID=42345 RepID=A0A8B9AKB8_PHODC|nr:uncharacterized protein At3g28850-like [Phoenix dactylifera]